MYGELGKKIPPNELLPFSEFSKLLDSEDSKQQIYNEAVNLGIPLGTPEQFAEDVAPDASLGKDIKLGVRQLGELIKGIGQGMERTITKPVMKMLGVTEEDRQKALAEIEALDIPEEEKQHYRRIFQTVEEAYTPAFEEETLPQGPASPF